MAAAFVKEVGTYKGSSATSTGVVTVGASGVAKGNHLLICAACASATRTWTCTDTQTNTYQNDVNSGNVGGVGVGILSAYMATALANTNTITVTISGTATNFEFGVYEVSGLVTTGWFDVSAVSFGTSVTYDTTATATISQANEFAMACGAWIAGSGTFTPGTGWTAVPTDPIIDTVTTIRLLAPEYKVVSSIGTVQATGTYSNVSADWAAAVATYKAAAGIVPLPTVVDTAVARAASY